MTKNFLELVQRRAAADPAFAAELLRERSGMPSAEDDHRGTLTLREALRLIWQADHYPIRGNEDLPVALRMDREAFARAAYAMPLADDPPEFEGWLAALLDPSTPPDVREEAMWALYDLFDPETHNSP